MKAKAAIACNVFIAAFTAVAMFMTLTGWMNPASTLMTRGVANLKFFTVLSNLFSGIVSVAFAVALVRVRGDFERLSPALKHLKLMAVTAVTVTFLTVVVLFCIIFGLRHMFGGANLWFHLVLPLVAIIEYAFVDGPIAPSPLKSGLATLPVIVYGIGYYANILINGIGEWPHTNDFYGFMSWGYEGAPIVALVMVVGTWLIALVLRALNRLICGKQPH